MTTGNSDDKIQSMVSVLTEKLNKLSESSYKVAQELKQLKADKQPRAKASEQQQFLQQHVMLQ